MQQDRFTVKAQEAIAAAQRLAGARRNAQVAPHHVLLALLEQDGGIVVPVLRRANADPESVRRRANEALDALPTLSGDAEAPTSLGSDLVDVLAPRRRGRPLDGRRVRLHRAPAARPGRRPQGRRRRLARAARRGGRAGARPPPRDRPEPRGPLPGARALRPRPHRGRRERQARSGDRARRGDPARDPGALPPHEEQPRPDRRARRRQDRDRRGPGAAHRRRRRARVAARPARDRPRHRLADRGRQVPRRVRGPAEGRAEGDRRRRRAR